MVRRGTAPASVRGQSAPMVLVTLRPLGVLTSHAQPEPKAVLPAVLNWVTNSSRYIDIKRVDIS